MVMVRKWFRTERQGTQGKEEGEEGKTGRKRRKSGEINKRDKLGDKGTKKGNYKGSERTRKIEERDSKNKGEFDGEKKAIGRRKEGD